MILNLGKPYGLKDQIYQVVLCTKSYQFFVPPGEEIKWYKFWKTKRLEWRTLNGEKTVSGPRIGTKLKTIKREGVDVIFAHHLYITLKNHMILNYGMMQMGNRLIRPNC